MRWTVVTKWFLAGFLATSALSCADEAPKSEAQVAGSSEQSGPMAATGGSGQRAEPGANEADGGAPPAPDEPLLGARARRLAVGWSHACALKASGEAVCGGWDFNKESSDCPTGEIQGVFAPPPISFADLDAE